MDYHGRDGGNIKPNKEIKFPELFGEANSIVKNKLILKTEIIRLHEIRNGTQHKGIIPSDRDIESSLIYAEDFLARGFHDCLHLNFNEISVSDLVIDPELKAFLKKIEKLIMLADYKNATNEAAVAFDSLKNKFMKYYDEVGFRRGHVYILDILFSLFDMSDQSAEAKQKRKTIENIANGIANELERLNDRIFAISLGANMQEYLFFRNNTPRVHFAIRGPRFTAPDSLTYAEEKIKKILVFLQNVIIHWESLKA